MGDELLVFDSTTDRAHSLNAAAASVWRACDGTRDIDALAERCGLDPVAVGLALDSLRNCGLLIDFEGPRVSRRQALRTAAVLGAGIAAVPVIRSIVAPTVAMAASSACVLPGDACTAEATCCSSSFCNSHAVCHPGSARSGTSCVPGQGSCLLGSHCSSFGSCAPA
jgi:Coenzyme PQQ synthesis protein D (PqqD)